MTVENNGAAGADNNADLNKQGNQNVNQQNQNNNSGDPNNQGNTFLNDDGSKGAEGQNSEPGWREKIAGGDEKFLEQLKRFGDEATFGKTYRELEKLKNQIKKPLPENPTAEQIAAWRKDNGIPETPDKYEIKFEDGYKLPDEYKPAVDGFLKAMHDQNAPPALVNQTLNWYIKQEQMAEVQRVEAEKAHRQEAIEKLRTELGPEYKATQGMIQAWLGRQGEVGNALVNARGPDGRALFNNPDFVLWLNNYIRQTEPSATVIHDTEMAGSSIDDEISKIQDVIRNDPQKYNNDPKMQERLQKLKSAKAA